MRSLKAICGVTAIALLLSGCGGGSASTGASSSSPTATATSAGISSSVPSTGSAKLTWSAPTTNANGTALTDLAGFQIHYGNSASAMTNVVNVANASTVSYVVTNLSAGTWYFAVSAYTTSGLDSTLSNIGSKTIT